MKEKYREQWENLGESDPYWAVLTDTTKKGRKWNTNNFFATGEKEVHSLLQKVSELHAQIQFDTVLDFGCGVGRLSRALSKRFKKVIAVDVSKSMLYEAKKANQHFTNIDFLHNPAIDLRIIQDGSIDFLYSNIVLQHIQKIGQVQYIREFCRVMRPNGIIAFQTPSKCNLTYWKGWVYWLANNRVLNIARRIKYGPSGIMEMHTLPTKTVLEALNQGGMRIIDIQRYDSAGPAFESYMYFAEKR